MIQSLPLLRFVSLASAFAGSRAILQFVTAPSWRNVWSRWPCVASQRRAVQSSLPDSNKWAQQDRLRTGPECPVNSNSSPSRSDIRTIFPSRKPTKTASSNLLKVTDSAGTEKFFLRSNQPDERRLWIASIPDVLTDAIREPRTEISVIAWVWSLRTVIGCTGSPSAKRSKSFTFHTQIPLSSEPDTMCRSSSVNFTTETSW